MHETVPDHFVLPLETFPAFAPRTAIDRTVMRSVRAVHVLVRPVGNDVISFCETVALSTWADLREEVLCLERRSCTSTKVTFEAAHHDGARHAWRRR